MHRGYFKFWRKAKDSGLSCHLLGFFVHCLMDAAHSERDVVVAGQMVRLEPGQFVFGRLAWMKELGLSERVTRDSISNLQKRSIIKSIRTSSKYTIFKIVNWELYQGTENQNVQQNVQQNVPLEVQQTSSRRPHTKNLSIKNFKSKDFCADPSEAEGIAQEVAVVDPVVWELLTNTGEPYPITESKISELSPLYPAVNVFEEIGKAKGWLIGNPEKRKTKRGMMRFITSWLSRRQDSGGGGLVQSQSEPRATTVHQQKQIEGEQKAAGIEEIFRRKNEQGRCHGMDSEVRLGLPDQLRPESDRRAGNYLDGTFVGQK